MPSGKVQARYVNYGERSTFGLYTTEKLAGAALARVWDAINRGTHRDRSKGQIVFRDFVTEMHDLRTADLSRHVANVESILRRWLLPKFGGRRLNDIDPEVINRWMSQLRRRTGAVSRRKVYYGLKGWMVLAKKYGYLAENPCATDDAGRDVHKERPFLDVADFARIVAAAEPWMKTVLRVIFGAHLRLVDVCGLNRGDIDLKTMTVLVERQAQQAPGGLQLRETKTCNASARGGATTRDLMERAGHRSSAASLPYQKSTSTRDAEVAAAADKLMAG